MLQTPAQPGESASPARESDGVDGSPGKAQQTSMLRQCGSPHILQAPQLTEILMLLDLSSYYSSALLCGTPQGRQAALNTVHHCAGRVHNGAVGERAGFAMETKWPSVGTECKQLHFNA